MSTYLYLFLNLGSVFVPFIFSFHPKLKFYKLWRPLFLSVFITMIFFITWDVLFTKNGFWGFNEEYYMGIKLLSLPVEEWLFFICIPYACVFTHYSLLAYFPNLRISEKNTKSILVFLLILFFLLVIIKNDRWYTLINYGYAIILILIVMKQDFNLLQRYLPTFMVMLIPFFIVNGILTGSFIENEVVWYNDNENLGIRLGTIPVEDVTYAFTLILTNLYLTGIFKRKLFQ